LERAKVYALDDLYDSVRVVGARARHVLHLGWRHSSIVGARGGCIGNPANSGTPVNRLTRHQEKKMPLLNIVVVLIVIGVALWLINNYIPMASAIKAILNIVVVVSVGVWLLKAVGLWGSVTSYRFTQ